ARNGLIRADFKNSSPQKACLFEIEFLSSAGAASQWMRKFSRPPPASILLRMLGVVLTFAEAQHCTIGAGQSHSGPKLTPRVHCPQEKPYPYTHIQILF